MNETYLCWLPDEQENEGDAKELNTFFPFEAAEKFAKQYDRDSAMEAFDGDTPQLVRVMDKTTRETLDFYVTREYLPRYFVSHARKTETAK